MPRPKKVLSSAKIPASGTSHLFGSRKPPSRGELVTSERIAEDLAKFHSAGGEIEVLGITRTLVHIDTPEAGPAAAPSAAAAPRGKGRR